MLLTLRILVSPRNKNILNVFQPFLHNIFFFFEKLHNIFEIQILFCGLQECQVTLQSFKFQ